MGFALGRSFVNKTFAGASKDIARDMIEKIEKAQGSVIDGVSWMDAKTKEEAKSKLTRLVNQIGYPDNWRKYDGIKITKESYLANRYELQSFNSKYELSKIGKPLNRTDWGMSPSMVNAYYDPAMNKMVFPAGILQPPFFSESYSAAANYGGIGMIMGHEISHGYDDEGRQFNGYGAMANWWTEASLAGFSKQSSCLAKQYESYPTSGGGHVNGNLTLGEDIGDQGGLKTTYIAWKGTLKKEILDDPSKLRSEEKKFFQSFAQAWCGKDTDAFEQTRVKTDAHPPNRYRVNGALANFSEFGQAYQCKENSKMAPKEKCVVW
jgi:predicted metalloendopeptidase